MKSARAYSTYLKKKRSKEGSNTTLRQTLSRDVACYSPRAKHHTHSFTRTLLAPSSCVHSHPSEMRVGFQRKKLSKVNQFTCHRIPNKWKTHFEYKNIDNEFK